jgi:hypothetical protein
MAALASEPATELAACRRFARTLETEQKNDARRRRILLESAFGFAKQRKQLIPNDLDDLLDRGKAFENRLIRGLVANPVDERLDDLEVDVCLEQGKTNFAERGLDVLLRQAHLSPQGGEGTLDAVT